MDYGVEFALKNSEEAIKFIDEHPEYLNFKGRIIKEYNFLKSFKKTGDLYNYYLKFRNKNHKYSHDFSFLDKNGIISNEKLADYIEKNYMKELKNSFNINDLKVGNVYSNNEIRNVFKCSDMGGMRRSKETNSLVLIVKHSNPLYEDSWVGEDVLHFTGMGKEGDQRIDFGQNKTLAISNGTDIKIFLFESFVSNEYYFYGEVFVDGAIYTSREIDINGKSRIVIKFPLRRLSKEKVFVNSKEIEASYKEKANQVRKYSEKEIKEKAKILNGNVSQRQITTLYRDRNQIISDYTKQRANGKCDLCEESAPFFDGNGLPYLEEHHVITLSEGGPDAIYNTVALCPNCHRKVHILKDGYDVKKLQSIILKYLTDDNDAENLKEYKKIFEEWRN